jgi:DNA invertase Pin-like site-specific DNA recombinase
VDEERFPGIARRLEILPRIVRQFRLEAFLSRRPRPGRPINPSQQRGGYGASRDLRKRPDSWIERANRAGVRRVLGRLGKGDVLMVTRLSRLARSTRDPLNTLAAVAVREAGFRSLGDARADTTTAHGRLMLTVLGGLAEFERELIPARTGEGRERAKARGVKMDRKLKLTPHQIREAIGRRDNGETVRDIARSYNVSHSTISRLATRPE